MKIAGEMCLDGGKSDRMAFRARAELHNHAIGWLQKGIQFPWRSDAGTILTNLVVIWRLSAKHFIRYFYVSVPLIFDKHVRRIMRDPI